MIHEALETEPQLRCEGCGLSEYKVDLYRDNEFDIVVCKMCLIAINEDHMPNN